MATTLKTSQLPQADAINNSDLFNISHDSSGTLISQKITWSNVIANVESDITNLDIRVTTNESDIANVESDITDIDLALDTKANISGQIFTGEISATNLSNTNTGDETKTTIEDKLLAANATNNGYLSSVDFSTFSNTWSIVDDQVELIGDKSGEFDLITTGLGKFNKLGVNYDLVGNTQFFVLGANGVVNGDSGGGTGITCGDGATGTDIAGGPGGSNTFRGGAGGATTKGVTGSGYGGSGGQFNLIAGAGGTGTKTGGTGEAGGGSGGDVQIVTGRGGNAVSDGIVNGYAGYGGRVIINNLVFNGTQGAGGSATTATTATNRGGEGCKLSFSNGKGGDASGGSINTGGAGGDIQFLALAGGKATSALGTTATGGRGADINFTGATSSFFNGSASGGGTNVGGAGSNINFTSGNGAGATGGTSNIGGAGGTLTFQAGIGGAGTTTLGANGNIIFKLSTTEIARFDNTATKTGRLGIGTTAPDKQVEINSATGNNLRLTYNDSNGSATNYIDFDVSSTGDLTITPSGGDVLIAGRLSTKGRYTNIITVTTTYTVQSFDEVIICNNSSAFTVTLPVASASGRTIAIKNINTGVITVEGDSSDTIDTELTQQIINHESLQLVDYALNSWIAI